MYEVDPIVIARRVLEKHFTLIRPEEYHYPEILSFHAMAELAVRQNDAELLKRCLALMEPLYTGKLTHHFGSYDFYRLGGSGFALLVAAGALPEQRETLRCAVEQWLDHGPRDKHGVLASQSPGHPSSHIFIDLFFATCPFLAFAANACDREVWRNEAVSQLEMMRKLFCDPATGLYHQSLGKIEPDELSDDYWSRGNGWGLFALAGTFRALPNQHPGKATVGAILADHLAACCQYQDENGMLHQEMSRPDSYVESSGTGLFLYALGVALEAELVPETRRDNLLAGLRGYLSYIAFDGSVHNSCCGCLGTGDGSKEAYMAVKFRLNDPHAFGPAALAFGQAANLGIDTVADDNNQ